MRISSVVWLTCTKRDSTQSGWSGLRNCKTNRTNYSGMKRVQHIFQAAQTIRRSSSDSKMVSDIYFFLSYCNLREPKSQKIYKKRRKIHRVRYDLLAKDLVPPSVTGSYIHGFFAEINCPYIFYSKLHKMLGTFLIWTFENEIFRFVAFHEVE